MNISITTVITISVSITIMLIILLPILHSNSCLKRLGSGFCIWFYIVVVVRALLPAEFSFSKTIRCPYIMPTIRDILFYSVTFAGMELSVYQLLLFIWLAVAGALLLLRGVKFSRLYRLIRRMPCTEDVILLDAWKTILDKYPKWKHVKVVEVGIDISPFVVGMRKPIIVMPKYAFTQREYQFILEHEILHCAHHDLLIKVAADILCTIYWWNPIFSYLKRRIFDTIEIGNDSKLIKNISHRDKEYYTECLVSMAKKVSATQVAFTVPFNKSNYRELKKRVSLIADTRKEKKWTQIVVFFVLIITLWIGTSFTFEPYSIPNGNYIILNKENSFIIRRENVYDIYYNDEFFYTTDSLEYFNENIKIYENEEACDK